MLKNVLQFGEYGVVGYKEPGVLEGHIASILRALE
jgi:hypothetical protein